MKRIGIIAALPGELKPLVRGWAAISLPSSRKGDRAWAGRIGDAECLAVAAGMGQEAASRACGIAAQWGELSALVSLGWAGALSCGVKPGNSYPVGEVIDVKTGERFTANIVEGSGTPLRLVTVDRIVQPAEKRKLAESYHAVLADMEAATVARLALARGIAFYCFKSVSDEANAVLPDFNRFTDTRGRLQMAPLLAHLSVRPKYWAAMARMGKNTKTGAAAMASALAQFFV